MAISYNTGTTAFTTSSGTASGTFTIPAGVLTGDVMLVYVACFNTNYAGTPVITLTSSATTPTRIGATQAASNAFDLGASCPFWIAATASDPGATLTYGVSGLSAGPYWFNAGLVSYTGAYNAAPVDCSAGTSLYSASSTGTTTTPSAMTMASQDWQVQFLGVNPPFSEAFTVPAGLTGRQSILAGVNGSFLLNIADSGTGIGGGTSIGNTTWVASGSGPGSTWSTSFTVGLASHAASMPQRTPDNSIQTMTCQ